MNIKPIIILLLLVKCSFLFGQKEKELWTEKEKIEKIKNLEDSTKWDKKMLIEDLKFNNPSQIQKENMDFGIFPVNPYELGLASGSNIEKNYFGKKIFWNYFATQKDKYNEKFLQSKNTETFFVIVILTDLLPTDDSNINISSRVISRNYPNKTATGILKTKTNSIEYIAFLTADRRQYALVNLRLFDMDQGRLILIAPQKDGSLRSKQILMPILDYEEVNKYVKEKIQEPAIKSFFIAPGNI